MKHRGTVIQACIFLLLLTHLVLLTGCILNKPRSGANASRKASGALAMQAGTTHLNQAQLQALVMNFSDIYVMSTWQAYDEIRVKTTNHKTRARAQYFKVLTTSSAMSIAAGRDPAVNLLDMLVFVSLDRHSIEDFWMPKVLGPDGESLAKTYRKLEQEIWKISAKVLSEAQQKKVRDLIQQWIAANPEQHYTVSIRFTDFAELHEGSQASRLEVGGLLADIEKAVAVTEEGLLLSERVMFLAERAPRVMTIQTDLILDQIAAAPDAEQLRSNLNKLTESTERISLVLADLPKLVKQARQEAIDHAFNRFGAERKLVMNDLESQEYRLRGVLEEVGGILDRATPLTEKANTTVRSADTLYRLVDSSPSNLPRYNELLEKSIVAMDKLERILAEVTPMYAKLAKDTDVHNDPLFGKTLGLADHLFWRGMLLIGFFLVGLLAVLLAYKRLSLRMSGMRKES